MERPKPGVLVYGRLPNCWHSSRKRGCIGDVGVPHKKIAQMSSGRTMALFKLQYTNAGYWIESFYRTPTRMMGMGNLFVNALSATSIFSRTDGEG